MSRFRIDHGGRGQTTAGHSVGIFLLDYDTVFDEFGSGWWQLAPYGRRSRRNRLLLRRATGQKQANQQPSFAHAFVFALSRLSVDGNLGYTSCVGCLSHQGHDDSMVFSP